MTFHVDARQVQSHWKGLRVTSTGGEYLKCKHRRRFFNFFFSYPDDGLNRKRSGFSFEKVKSSSKPCEYYFIKSEYYERNAFRCPKFFISAWQRNHRAPKEIVILP